MSRRVRKRETRKNIAAVLIVAIFALAIFSINSIGKFIAEKIICPVVNLSGNDTTTTEKAETEQVEFYLLSSGTFDTEAQAEENEDFCGYVFKNDGKYICVKNCFLTKSEAEKSKEQTEMSEIKTPALSIKITGTEEQVEMIKKVFSELSGTAKDLLEANEEYTLGEASKLQTLTKFQKCKDKITDIYAELESLKSENATVKAASEMCACGKTIFDELPKSNDKDFSEKVKYIACAFACEYYIFCNELG